MDIIIYQPFVNEIKELIQRKQFQAIKIVNTETINLYWEIGEEIYRQQREKGGEIHCTDIGEGVAKGVPRNTGIFSGKSVENA